MGLAAGLLVLALAWLLAAVQSVPPEAKAKEVPLTEFSGHRARGVLRDLIGDGAPHPVGSPAGARVRERILAHLRWLGYTPEVEEDFACGPHGACARVRNVLARLPGAEPGKVKLRTGKKVLLMAHYDSVPAGPGAGDDLAGVAAVLEIARVLKSGPTLRHGVIFLLDDGEEAGLLGARAFVERSPAMREVGAVVNLEARGTSGPSLMFESSGPDAWTVSRFAQWAPRPFASSLFATVYRYLPNDTDLTVFQGRGVPGLNFAFVGDPAQYHTPLDRLQNLSPASLQHHGDNALAAVRGLAESSRLARPPAGRAVFFDFLRRTVVSWPAGLSPWLGLLALGLTLAAAALARRRGSVSWGGAALGLAVPPAALLLTLAAAFGLQALLAGVFPSSWVARPLPAKAAFWLLALAVTLWAAVLLTRRHGFGGAWTGIWILWSLAGLVLGMILPGLSYLFVVPALVAGLAGLLGLGRPLATVLPALAAGLIWFPVLIFLYDALGLTGLLAAAVLLALVFATLAPLVAVAGPGGRRWLPLGIALAAVVFAASALVSPPYSPDSPQALSVQLHHDADAGATRWLLRGGPPYPPGLLAAAGFGGRPAVAFPWSPPSPRALAAPAPPLAVSAPELVVMEQRLAGGKRHLRLRLSSPRGAPIGTVYVPESAELESIEIDGRSVPLGERPRRGSPGLGAGGWQRFTNFTLSSAGSELNVVLGAVQPGDWYVLDRSPGLPPAGRALAAARPKDAVPAHDGDVTLVSRKVRI
jgi:hypothetical protein